MAFPNAKSHKAAIILLDFQNEVRLMKLLLVARLPNLFRFTILKDAA
jgi:hypothetical protein